MALSINIISLRPSGAGQLIAYSSIPPRCIQTQSVPITRLFHSSSVKGEVVKISGAHSKLCSLCSLCSLCLAQAILWAVEQTINGVFLTRLPVNSSWHQVMSLMFARALYSIHFHLKGLKLGVGGNQSNIPWSINLGGILHFSRILDKWSIVIYSVA